MNQTKYTKNDISKIQEALPRGSYQEIADECGYDSSYVARVLKNRVTANYTIIEAAKAIIRREYLKTQKIVKRIEGKAA